MHSKLTTDQRPRVAVVSYLLAHYQLPLCERMLDSRRVAFSLFADDVVPPHMASLKLMAVNTPHPTSAPARPRFQVLRSIWLGRNILWQRGVLRALLFQNWAAVILVGNPRVCSTWVAALLLRMRGIRVAFWTHGFYGHEPTTRKALKNVFFRIADQMLVYSDASRADLIDKGYKPSAVLAVYNSLNFDLQDQIFRSLNSRQRMPADPFGQSRPYVVFVGRLEEDKRVDLLILAVARMRKRGIDLSVLVAGDGPARSRLVELAAQEGESASIQFCGAIYDEETLGPILTGAVAVVCPARVGLLAVHALTYGVPLVTHGDTPLHGPEVEIISDGVNGSFFRRDDIDGLSTAIGFWLARWPRSPEVIESCRRPILERYNPGSQLKILEDAFGPASSLSADDVEGETSTCP